MIEQFSVEAHGDMVRSWFEARGSGSVVDWTMVSPYGVMVDGILVVWLYRTDARFMFIDSMVSDPTSAHAARSVAMQESFAHFAAIAAKANMLLWVLTPEWSESVACAARGIGMREFGDNYTLMLKGPE